MASVTLNIAPLQRLSRAVRPSSSAMTPLFKKLALRYLTFSQRRFDRLSKGGSVQGESWEPLAESTKEQRRGPRRGFKGPRKFAILTDTGTLKRALLQGSPGNLIQRVPNGIKAGIGGGAHADAGMTIGRLAEIHHEGQGNNPERTVLTANIDDQTKRGMARDAATEMRRIIAGGNR